MKHIYLVFFLFSTCFAFGQNFEGTLIYSNHLELSEKFSAKTGMTLVEIKEHSVKDKKFKLPKLKPQEELGNNKTNLRYYIKN